MTLEIVPDATILKFAYASVALRVLILGWHLLNEVFATKPCRYLRDNHGTIGSPTALLLN